MGGKIRIEQILQFSIIAAIVLFVFSKLFLCSVSFDGSDIRTCMIADYWNFGKDFLRGKVFYKELIDHKGFYLHLLYAFLIFISNNHIAIMVVVETTIYVITILSFYHYTKIVCQHSNTTVLLFLLGFSLSFLVVCKDTPLLNTEGISTIVLILLLCRLRKTETITFQLFLVIGVILGILTSIKVTTIVVYFPLFVHICAKHICNGGTIRKLINSITAGLIGFILAVLPLVIYLIYHDCTSNFINIYLYAIGDGGVDIRNIMFVVISSALCLLSVILMIQKKEFEHEVTFISSVLVMSVAFSATTRYHFALYVSIVYILLFHISCVKQRLVTILLMLQVVIMVPISIGNTVTEIADIIKSENLHSTKTVAERYDITNANMLYIWEDIGYGVYSYDTFQVPQQWLPERFFNSSGFIDEYIDMTIERIENKEFEYVYFISEVMLDEITTSIEGENELSIFDTNKLKLFKAVRGPLLENYDCIEELKGFVYKRKDEL